MASTVGNMEAGSAVRPEMHSHLSQSISGGYLLVNGPMAADADSLLARYAKPGMICNQVEFSIGNGSVGNSCAASARDMSANILKRDPGRP